MYREPAELLTQDLCRIVMCHTIIFYGRPSFKCILRKKICPGDFLPLLIGDLTPYFRNCFEKILKNIFRAGMPCHERPDLYSSCLWLPERYTVPQADIS